MLLIKVDRSDLHSHRYGHVRVREVFFELAYSSQYFMRTFSELFPFHQYLSVFLQRSAVVATGQDLRCFTRRLGTSIPDIWSRLEIGEQFNEGKVS